ncbi:hypothetical protein NKH77_26125 [Streptomyces sp. M19]
MTAARLTSRLRQEPRLRGVAMGDLYAHPPWAASPASSTPKQPPPRPGRPPVRTPPPRAAALRHSTARVMACGVAQLLAL